MNGEILENNYADLKQTNSLLKQLKTPEAKEAIRKLRYLLILTQHYIKYGGTTDDTL